MVPQGEGVCQAQPWKPRVVQRLETPRHRLLHGLHTLGLGYPSWPCWLGLALVSPALSLDSWSRATASELATSSTDDCACSVVSPAGSAAADGCSPGV